MPSVLGQAFLLRMPETVPRGGEDRAVTVCICPYVKTLRNENKISDVQLSLHEQFWSCEILGPQ